MTRDGRGRNTTAVSQRVSSSWRGIKSMLFCDIQYLFRVRTI